MAKPRQVVLNCLPHNAGFHGEVGVDDDVANLTHEPPRYPWVRDLHRFRHMSSCLTDDLKVSEYGLDGFFVVQEGIMVVAFSEASDLIDRVDNVANSVLPPPDDLRDTQRLPLNGCPHTRTQTVQRANINRTPDKFREMITERG